METSAQVGGALLMGPILVRVGLLPAKVDTSPGRILDSSGLRVGRQAQIIPVLHSMADHEAAPTLSSGC